jgi:hypothetical protein
MAAQRKSVDLSTASVENAIYTEGGQALLDA